MKKLKIYLLTLLILISFSAKSFSKGVPESFADLAEKLMPSVVNISTTQTVVTNVNPFPFQFPPGSPFEDMFKEFGAPQERKSSALGSGFIIDEKGIVVTNNHVIQDAEDAFSDLSFELSVNPPVIFVELVDSTSTLLIYSPFYVGEVVLSGTVTDKENLSTEFTMIILIEEAVTNEFDAERAHSFQLFQN